MTPADLEAWRIAMAGQLGRKPTRKAVSLALDISTTTYRKYERGKTAIPLATQLACAALIRGIKPWPE